MRTFLKWFRNGNFFLFAQICIYFLEMRAHLFYKHYFSEHTHTLAIQFLSFFRDKTTFLTFLFFIRSIWVKSTKFYFGILQFETKNQQKHIQITFLPNSSEWNKLGGIKIGLLKFLDQKKIPFQPKTISCLFMCKFDYKSQCNIISANSYIHRCQKYNLKFIQIITHFI